LEFILVYTHDTFIIVVIHHLTSKKIACCRCIYVFGLCNKGARLWSDEPKHVAYCCITLKCCVWLRTSFVFQQCQKVAKTVKIWSHIPKSETVLRTLKWETLYFYRKLIFVFSFSYLSKLPTMYETALYYKKCTKQHTNKHHNYTAHKTRLHDAYMEPICIAPMNTGVNRI
jgi:hypothetical protein